MRGPSIDLVLPALDEARAIGWLMARMPDSVRPIVVDNDSRDGTADIARRAGATVVHCSTRGYGAACQAGLAAADAEFVAFCDCDATIDPGEVLAGVEALRAGADLAVSRRWPVGGATFPLPHRAANRALALTVSRGALRDIGPLRVARLDDYRALGVADPGGGYPVETVRRARSAGWRITPFDIAYRRRIGTSKVSGNVHGALTAARDIARVSTR